MSQYNDIKPDFIVAVPSAKTEDLVFDSILKSESADGHGIGLPMASLTDSTEPIKDSKVSPPITFLSRTLDSPCPQTFTPALNHHRPEGKPKSVAKTTFLANHLARLHLNADGENAFSGIVQQVAALKKPSNEKLGTLSCGWPINTDECNDSQARPADKVKLSASCFRYVCS